ncbi:MAG: hypothetical protein FHK80_02375 [Azoarcus sp. PHD]|nr:MAG: hypothetical protein FHK80_02375 [Azoarcus sp. PHD]
MGHVEGAHRIALQPLSEQLGHIGLSGGGGAEKRENRTRTILPFTPGHAHHRITDRLDCIVLIEDLRPHQGLQLADASHH